MAMLRTVEGEHQQEWDNHLSILCKAYQSSEHRTTGYTPNMMMLGKELPMVSHLLNTTPERTNRKDHRPLFVQELEKRIQ